MDSGTGGKRSAAVPVDRATTDNPELTFEDPYEDDIEEEDIDDEEYDDDDDEENEGGSDEEKDAAAATATGDGAGPGDESRNGSSSSSAAAVGHSTPSLASAEPGPRASSSAAAGPRAAGAGGGVLPGGHDVWRPGQDALEADEDLDYDPSAYVMYHSLVAEWPCLSFDVVPDRLGVGRTRFPMSMTLVAGTQADKPGNNRLMVMRLTAISKMEPDSSRSSESEDEDEDDDDPVLDVQRIVHSSGGVNRVRVMPQAPGTLASWSDCGKVHVWDIRQQLRVLDAAEGKGAAPPVHKGYGPLQTFSGHATEGYAMDWSGVVAGRLATGDCAGAIHVWDPVADASGASASAPVSSASAAAAPGSSASAQVSSWSVEGPFTHAAARTSIEDLQWSPNEATVFASASTDGCVRIWDTRSKARSMLSVSAHATDVNVISWSKMVSYLLASGADDGGFRVWDLRNFKAEAPIAHFQWHTKQITSIEWSFDDENVLAVGSADNTVTLWDMSLEEDEDAEIAQLEKQARAAALADGDAPGADGAAPHFELPLPSTRDARLKDIPPQLLFIHAGQKDVKEVHWHRQLPGVVISTAADGFNLFKPDLLVTK